MNNNWQTTTAVIVSYNSRKYINNALESLREAHVAGFLKCVVVDNASGDGTADFVTDTHPWVSLVRSAQNVGFGRGCNLGFQHVDTPFVLIHNPDAVIGYKDLRNLVAFMESHAQAGIVAPSIMNEDGSLQYAGMQTTPVSLLRSALGCSNAISHQRIIKPGETPFQTPWVCGAMMLIRSEVYRHLEGFDPRFFLYFEETDLCHRALQKGFEIWAVGSTVAKHLGSACAKSTGQPLVSSCIAKHFYQSRFYYLIKHFGVLNAVLVEMTVRVLGDIRRWRNYLLRGQELVPNNCKGTFLRLPARLDNHHH